MTTITMKVPPEMARRLDAEAKARGLSRSALIRSAIRELLESERDRPATPSVLDLAGSAVGALEGPSDLSTHPGHLDGYGT